MIDVNQTYRSNPFTVCVYTHTHMHIIYAHKSNHHDVHLKLIQWCICQLFLNNTGKIRFKILEVKREGEKWSYTYFDYQTLFIPNKKLTITVYKSNTLYPTDTDSGYRTTDKICFHLFVRWLKQQSHIQKDSLFLGGGGGDQNSTFDKICLESCA